MSDIALPAPGVPPLPRSKRLLGDERLAKLAGKGNARAFAQLYKRHHQAIYRYCRSILGNDHDAQEALQTTMMRAYAALARQERDLAVKAWLFRIAHNEAITLLRRRRPEQELGEEVESVADLDATLDTRERLRTLMGDVATLPDRQRAALVMRELSGLSIHEIGQALSISDGAAKQTLFEARSSLHELSQGRAMGCETVREAISQRDGRVLRGRRLRAHLAACEDCRAFRDAIAIRQADLRALAPVLPLASAGAIFARLLSAGGSGQTGATAGVGTVATGSGASLTGHTAASLLAKGLAGTAVIAAAAAGTAHLASPSHHAATAPPRAARDSTSALRLQGPDAAARQASPTANHGAATAKPRPTAVARLPGASSTEPGAAPQGASSSQSARSTLGFERGAAGQHGHPLPGASTVGRHPATRPLHQKTRSRRHAATKRRTAAGQRRHNEHRRPGSAQKGAQPGAANSKRPPKSSPETNASGGGGRSGQRPSPTVEAGESQAPTATAPGSTRSGQ